MWTKILIFMVVFFLVANPATFKIMRGLLGGWVASADGLAKPAGLVLHAAVFVALAIFLPRALMRVSGYADDEEYAEDEKEEYAEDEEYRDLVAEADKADAQARIAADKARTLRARASSSAAAPAVAAPGAAPLTTTTMSRYAEEPEEFGGYGSMY